MKELIFKLCSDLSITFSQYNADSTLYRLTIDWSDGFLADVEKFMFEDLLLRDDDEVPFQTKYTMLACLCRSVLYKGFPAKQFAPLIILQYNRFPEHPKMADLVRVFLSRLRTSLKTEETDINNGESKVTNTEYQHVYDALTSHYDDVSARSEDSNMTEEATDKLWSGWKDLCSRIAATYGIANQRSQDMRQSLFTLVRKLISYGFESFPNNLPMFGEGATIFLTKLDPPSAAYLLEYVQEQAKGIEANKRVEAHDPYFTIINTIKKMTKGHKSPSKSRRRRSKDHTEDEQTDGVRKRLFEDGNDVSGSDALSNEEESEDRRSSKRARDDSASESESEDEPEPKRRRVSKGGEL